MEEQNATILYILLTPDILVPLTWSIYRAENFVLRSIRRIIEISQQANPIIRLNNVPAQLVRNHPNGFPFVFKLVPTEQLIEGKVYDIILPVDENNNEIMESSGSGPKSSQESSLWARSREPLCILRAQLFSLPQWIEEYVSSDDE